MRAKNISCAALQLSCEAITFQPSGFHVPLLLSRNNSRSERGAAEEARMISVASNSDEGVLSTDGNERDSVPELDRREVINDAF